MDRDIAPDTDRSTPAQMAAIAGALPQNMSRKTAERAARVEAEIAGLSSRVDEKTQKRWGELVGHVFPEAQNTV